MEGLFKDGERNILEVGKMYGNVKVIEYAGYSIFKETLHGGKREGKIKNKRFYKWKVKCSICGSEKIMLESTIKRMPKSCGCNRILGGVITKREKIEAGLIKPASGINNGMYKHGGRGTRLYSIWKNMRYRCNNPNDSRYNEYGARGIKVCPEWDNIDNGFINFKEWAEFNGYSEDKDLSIERVDVNGNYCPSNCSWAGKKENKFIQQANNMTNNHIVNWGGVNYTISELADHFGIDKFMISNRLYDGKSIDEAVLMPKGRTGTAGRIDQEAFVKSHPLISDGTKLMQNPNAVNPLVSTKYYDLNMNDPKLKYYTQDELARMRGYAIKPQETEEEYQKAREAAKQALIEKLKNQ